MRLWCGILGAVVLEVDGARAALGGPRPRALYARLVVARGALVTAERLIDDLWAGDPPPAAANTLQSHVSGLRKALGPCRDRLVREGPCYGLCVDPDEVDAWRFERLAAEGRRAVAVDPSRARALLDEALACWRGAALSDVADEAWAAPTITHLDELRLATAEDRFDALLAVGEHHHVVGELERAVAEQPLRERLAGQLMLALYRSGRQADALAAYQRVRAQLAEELGLEPGPDLTRLEAAILVHDAGLAPAQEAPRAAGPAAPRAAALDVAAGRLPRPVAVTAARGPFVGRDAELAELRRLWAQLAEHGRLLAVVAGEAGIGKTRLAAAFAARTLEDEPDTVVLWGRCSRDPLGAYEPVGDALRGALDQLDGDAIARLSLGRTALSYIVPQLAEWVPGLDARVTADAQDDRRRLFDAISGMLADLAGDGRLLLVIDDLQWADPSSVRLLGHLLGETGPRRLFVLATLRQPTDDPNPAVAGLVADLRRSRSVARVSLGGLDGHEVTDLVLALGGRADWAEMITRAAGGNPFFTEELALHLSDNEVAPADLASIRLPDSVRDVLGHRLDRRSPTCQRLLAALAVAGPAATPAVLAHMIGVDESEVVRLAQEATEAGLLTTEGTHLFEFAHALVRQAVVHGIGPLGVTGLHLRAAEALDSIGGAPSELAVHLCAAGDAVPATRRAAALVSAGRVALRQLAFDEASELADRALALDVAGDAPEVASRAQLLRASAAWASGAPSDEVRRGLTQASTLARRADRPDLEAVIAVQAALTVSGLGFDFGVLDTELIDLLETALAHQPGEALVDRSRLLSSLVGARFQLDAPTVSVARADEALQLAQQSGDDVTIAAAYAAERQARWRPDQLDRRLEVVRLARQHAERAGNITLEMNAAVVGIADLFEAGRATEMLAALDRLRARLLVTPMRVYQAYERAFAASLDVLRGDYPAAERHGAEMVALGEGRVSEGVGLARLGQQLLVTVARGGAAAFVEPLRGIVSAVPHPGYRAVLAWTLAMSDDRDEAARMTAGLVDDGALALPQDWLWYLAASMLAETAFLLDDRALAAAVLPAVAPYDRRMAIAGLGGACHGPMARAAGLSALTLGHCELAAEHFAVAEELAVAFDAGPVLARLRDERALCDRRR